MRTIQRQIYLLLFCLVILTKSNNSSNTLQKGNNTCGYLYEDCYGKDYEYYDKEISIKEEVLLGNDTKDLDHKDKQNRSMDSLEDFSYDDRIATILPEYDVETEPIDSYCTAHYRFFPVAHGLMQFKVRAGHSAHVALTTEPKIRKSTPFYQIIIGGWGNNQSAIRRDNLHNKVSVHTPHILNRAEFRGFWVRFDKGVVSVGKEGELDPFMTWKDPEPFPVAFIGVCTAWKASGTWKVEVKFPKEEKQKFHRPFIGN